MTVEESLRMFGLVDSSGEVHAYADELAPAFHHYAQAIADEYLAGQKRQSAQKEGFDDYCEAHDLPYNNECPECAKHSQLINPQTLS